MADTTLTANAGERFWSILLGYIRAGSVIPVVGRDLLVIEHEGRRAPLMNIVADRIATEARTEGVLDERRHTLPPLDADISTVIGLIEPRSRDEFLGRTHELIRQLCVPTALPEPLRQLAAIDGFKLFISTTPDPFLTNHIAAVAPGGLLPWQRIAYLKGAGKAGLDVEKSKNWDAPVVYRLFGEITGAPNTCAITDEELLEYTYALQDPSNRPEKLFDALKDHHLLVLGTGFPDWLARFFLRLIKNQPFSSNSTAEYIAESDAHPDSNLGFFLQRYGQKSQLCPGASAAGFVAELYQRWQASVPSPDEARPGGLFISYSRADLPAVEVLAARLKKAQIPFWFDRRELRPGDAFWSVIDRNISVSSVFMPVISETTRSRTKMHIGDKRDLGFWREWLYALDCLAPGTDGGGMRRIIPIGVDATPIVDGSYLPESFRQVHYAHAPAGRPEDELLRTINDILKPGGGFDHR